MKREKAGQASCSPSESVNAGINRNLRQLPRRGQAGFQLFIILPAAFLLAISGCASHQAEEPTCGAKSAAVATLQHCNASTSQLYALADPMQGTDSWFSFSHGNLYPAIALPFPMKVWASYTQPQNDSFYYQYRHNTFYGIWQTHQPSPWIGDYANISHKQIVSGGELEFEMDSAPNYQWGVSPNSRPPSLLAELNQAFSTDQNSP